MKTRPIWGAMILVLLPCSLLFSQADRLSDDTIKAMPKPEVCYPPRNLTVDSATLLATWSKPVVTDTEKAVKVFSFYYSHLLAERHLWNRTDSFPPYVNFYVYLDDSLVGISTDTTFSFVPLDLIFNSDHTASVATHYATGLSPKIDCTFTSYYLAGPTDLTGDCSSLSWVQPQPVPDFLLGYNIYRDGDFVEFVEYTGEDTVSVAIPNLPPGEYGYTVTSVFDLTGFGFPGETGESNEIGPITVICSYGMSLPFFENWSSGTFDTNNWTKEGSNWGINGQSGNPAPSAEFNWDPLQTDYSISLESFPLRGDSLHAGQIYFDFDIKLVNVATTGTEQMLVEVWNWECQEWHSVTTFDNEYGSFTWTSVHLNITSYALSEIFKIRFNATGENSLYLLSWFIDNVQVYRMCEAPKNLTVYLDFYNWSLDLDWDPPFWIDENQWIHWDNGNNATSIGTDGEAEFDVAARWTPDQLTYYSGASVAKIAFFPGEASATYHVRIWTGEEGSGPANLIADQEVIDPDINAWNEVTLDSALLLDVNNDLWVGYYVNTTTGYPAGCDEGPAINGYGNMMNFGGWQTLLQINPDLDYNWNIQAYLTVGNRDFVLNGNTKDIPPYNIYRSYNGQPFEKIGFSWESSYIDDEDLLYGIYCYKVTAVYYEDHDICESDYSNEDCFIPVNALTKSSIIRTDIYPNPADDHLQIKSSERLETITLYSAIGKPVFSSDIEDYEETIKLHDFPSGMYLLVVNAGGQSVTKKILIMH